MSRISKYCFVATLAFLFGLLTIFSGGYALFGGEAARQAVGDAVPFVLWFNFLAGFAYITAGIGLWQHARWGTFLALLIAAATLVVFAVFGIHVYLGGQYEVRTVGALTLRSLFWIVISLLGWRWSIRPHG
ncbi:MAG: hypothetical protein GY789_07110 [Hyphomicrobiales bacterium]|nr:hypothetical protein [Hyphomicrobiales bacterium]MCP5001873.1 hypothetical protein [Hyphomicrobiales bacterium]